MDPKIFISSVDSAGTPLADLGSSFNSFVVVRFPNFFPGDFFAFPFGEVPAFAFGSNFSSKVSFGAIGLRGPNDLGAEYFLGPLGPRFSGLSAVFDALSFESVPSTNCAIDETLSSA